MQNNILTALLKAWVQEVFSCTHKFGTIGLVGAIFTLQIQLRPHYHLSWTIFTLRTSSRRRKNSEPSRTRMTTHIKALRWISLKLNLPILACLQSQTVSDFLKSKTRIPFERSEATPIPLAVLAAWENRIISTDTSPAEIITLGCFLIATMASLRFRDLLRTKPLSISLQGFILRGISWRTKTSVSGQPWGVCCLGISTRPTNGHWIHKFLKTLEHGVAQSQAYWGTDWEPDFLLPSWTDSIPFSSPCSYHHGLALIRYFSPDQALCLYQRTV